MTEYLYRLILDVTVNADSKEDADEIAKNIDFCIMAVDVWSSEAIYKGLGEGEE